MRQMFYSTLDEERFKMAMQRLDIKRRGVSSSSKFTVNSIEEQLSKPHNLHVF